MTTGVTDQIRKYARSEYVEPARRRGETRLRIVAGDVHRALRLQNRAPQVCSALRSRKFLNENHLSLEKAEGPPGGMSTTMTFTYRILHTPSNAKLASGDPLLRLWGIGKEVFQSLGGGEAFIRREREHFYDSGDES
jgi:hypothetical protein